MRIFDITFVFYFSTMLQTVRGMQDIFGEYQRYFTFLKKVARHEFRKNGFTRISTPVIEFSIISDITVFVEELSRTTF